VTTGSIAAAWTKLSSLFAVFTVRLDWSKACRKIKMRCLPLSPAQWPPYVDPSGYRLLMPFDYTLSEDEKTKWAGKLQDKQIVIGVRELVPFGGRLRARGAIINGPDGK
jgi:hypothetical protein